MSKPGVYTQYYSLHTILGNQFVGNVDFKEVMSKGDFGIGTFNNANGEMVAIDGKVYRTLPDSTTEEITDLSEKTPYSIVTFFEAESESELPSGINMEQFFQKMDELRPTKDDMYAVFIEGEFDWVRVRSPEPCFPPYKDLKTMIAEQQQTTLENISGNVLGFYTPEYLNTMGVQGYHVHFIDSARAHGGHTQDFILKSGVAKWKKLTQLNIIGPGGGISSEEISSAA